jgi:hypothetical protein
MWLSPDAQGNIVRNRRPQATRSVGMLNLAQNMSTSRACAVPRRVEAGHGARCVFRHSTRRVGKRTLVMSNGRRVLPDGGDPNGAPKEEMMYRKFLLIVAAIVGVAFAPAGALAARGGGGRGGFVGGGGRGFVGGGGRGFVGGGGRGFVGSGFRGGGFRGGAFRGGAFRGGRGWGWGYPAVGLGLGLGLVGAGYYGGYPYYGYGGCWQRVVEDGPYGPIVRRIWVCD